MSHYSKRGGNHERRTASRLTSSSNQRGIVSRDHVEDGLLSITDRAKEISGRMSPFPNKDSSWTKKDLSDSRISSQARLLSRAETEEVFINTCQQIENLLEISDNRKYFIKSFSTYLESHFMDTFKWIQGVYWRESGIRHYGKLLGVILNSLENHATLVCNWLLQDRLPQIVTARKYSLASTISNIVLIAIDELKPAQVTILIGTIQEQIDNISETCLFKIISNILLAAIMKNESNLDSAAFQDFSDIVIGWMTDGSVDELDDTYFHCYGLVQSMRPIFIQEWEFLAGLIQTIVDFIDEGGNESPIGTARILRLLKTLECLVALKISLDKKFLMIIVDRLSCTMNKILSSDLPGANGKTYLDFVLYTNEILTQCPGSDSQNIQLYLTNQLLWLQNTFDEKYSRNSELVNTFLLALNCWLEAVAAHNQRNETLQRLCEDVMSFLDKIQPNLSRHSQINAVRVCHSLLRTRNLSLLQSTYHWIIMKFHNDSANDDTRLNVLSCLADIATNKSGSILSLWALDPPIIDFLLGISKAYGNSTTVGSCALELLKAHCIAHSHFASNISSSKIFEAESPAVRFLKSLMEFWILMIKQPSSKWSVWFFDWICLYIKTTSSYATPLLAQHSDFYYNILKEFAKGNFITQFAEFLTWMIQEQNYSNSSPFQDILREICLEVLLSTNLEFDVSNKFTEILNVLPSSIVLPSVYSLPNICSPDNEWIDDGDETRPPILASAEVNEFLQTLLIYGRTDQPLPASPPKAKIKAAVDYIIYSKLKTTLGRAQEFFSQLQHMVRKILRKGVLPNFYWKLNFIYQLQRKILLCIHQSVFLSLDIPEGIRAFYVTNRVPCTGWLKRIGPECIEISLAMKCYPMAHFFAVSIRDDKKASLALLEMKDLYGLKGMNEIGGYLYLNSEYEKAQVMANTNPMDPVNEVILDRVRLIFERSVTKLEEWPAKPIQLVRTENAIKTLEAEVRKSHWNPELLKLSVDSKKTALALQLECFASKNDVIVVGSVENFSKLKLYEMIQVEEFMLNSRKLNYEEKRRVQSCKLSKMIDTGNLKYARNFITQSGWMDSHSGERKPERSVDVFRVLGDLLFKEENFIESGTLYSSILELIEKDSNAHGQQGRVPNEFKGSFYLGFADKIKNSEPFYNQAVSKSALLAALEGRHQTQQLLYDRSRDVSRNCGGQIRSDAWYNYASFAYERSEEPGLTPILREVLKSNALHSYSSYIKWNQKLMGRDEERSRIIVAMIRILKLYNQNHKFIPEDLVTSDLWLTILPELAKIEELRPYLLSRFPEVSSFLLASKEYVKNQKRFARRRGPFDITSIAYVEASEDSFESQSSKLLCSIEQEGKPMETLLNAYWAKSGLKRTKNCANSEYKLLLDNYVTLVKEIERIGTTNEELWTGVIQKMSVDWVKRANILRKDLARDHSGNPEKVKAYTYPLLIFLKELWKITLKGDTPMDVAFVCKYGSTITHIVDELEGCSTVEKFGLIYDSLTKFAYTLECAAIMSKHSLIANVSPCLAHFNFADNRITLPGMPQNVTISSVCGTILSLPTKTIPKRIGFRGTDGKMYEFLIKGNENLHVDAGIMQLLKIFEEFSGVPTRNYSVTPIGERGGLIQIVRNAIPLFVMYKKYLQRIRSLERPSEMFWKRLNGLGYKDRSNVQALKDVYRSLKSETPSELISRELLLCAVNTTAWYRAVQTFTRDTALGSAFGYVIGLADRHLDNILINLNQGQLTHVDFSLLFGKGILLKVPERVPFRLTQNIAEALQYPGIYGAFQVYLDGLLDKFIEGRELTMFSINNIAMDIQLEESCYINPEIIVRAEVKSTLELIRIRIRNIWKIMQSLVSEIMEISKPASSGVWVLNSIRTSSEKLKKKIYRWRRLLENLDPLLQFVVTHSMPTGSLVGFHEIVFSKWNPLVMHFWCHVDLGSILQCSPIFEDKFKLCEDVVQRLLYEIPTTLDLNMTFDIHPGVIVNSGEQLVDRGRLDSILNSVGNRLTNFVPVETAKILINEATDEDNLGQMFEGWISWV